MARDEAARQALLRGETITHRYDYPTDESDDSDDDDDDDDDDDFEDRLQVARDNVLR